MLLLEIALAIAAILTLVSVLIACVCGCRNHQQKSELAGTAGVVKLRFDEETPSPVSTTPASVKRASAQNSQRSLPEIPQAVVRHDSADTASDLIYATLNVDAVDSKPDAVHPTSRGDHSYEHPYAKVQNENHVHTVPEPMVNAESSKVEPEAPSTSALDSVVISAGVAIAGQLPSSQELPYMTPPSPPPHPPPAEPAPARTQQHFSGDSTDSAKGYTSISVREPLSNIRAITNIKTQQHYATVSDDSDEMYAAIDDPNGAGGSDTYAQIAPPPDAPAAPAEQRRSLEIRQANSPAENAVRRSAPPEVAIIVPNHSRQASAWSVTNSTGTVGSPKPEKRQANSPLPPPPAGRDTKNAGSSTGDLQISQEKHRRSLNEKHQRNNSCVSSSDFYGCNYPVEKHRFSSGDLIRPLAAKELNFDINKPAARDNFYNSIDAPSDSSSAEANTSLPENATESPSKNVEEMYAKVMKKNKKLHPSEDKTRKIYANENPNEPPKASRGFANDDPGYETIDKKRSANHGYETIADKGRKGSSQDPGYETVKHKAGANSNFGNNNLMKLAHLNQDSGPNSILSSDPGYEHIAKANSCPSDCDPNYEVLRNEPPTPPYATIAPNYNIPTYSVINKNRSNNDEVTAEPNYESMPHDIYTTGSESDPNYESVRPKDVNYESMSTNDPNYESLISKKDPKYESVRSNARTSKRPHETANDPNYESVRPKDPNYESVKYVDFNREPPYASVAGDTEDVSLRRSDSAAGYERINPAPHKSGVNGEGSTVDDYFQV